jgi:hypothetical protein
MMTKRTWTGTCGAIVAAATVGVMAQQTPPPANSASPDQITVIGCLKAAAPAAADSAAPGTPAATGTSGTAGAAATDADAKFVLTNATMGPAAPATPSSTDSAAASAAGASQTSAERRQTYRLVANAASLSPHVGKKLELTGTLLKPSNPASSEASAANEPALRVEKGKVVAASCDQ